MKEKKYSLSEIQKAFYALEAYLEAKQGSSDLTGVSLENVAQDIIAELRLPGRLNVEAVPCSPADWAAYPYDGEAYTD